MACRISLDFPLPTEVMARDLELGKSCGKECGSLRGPGFDS